jgi:hypothetical protein
MRIYALTLVVLAVFAAGAVRLAYGHGELDHVGRASAVAPEPVPPAPTAPSLKLSWRSVDRPAGGTPYSDGVVVTYAPHTISGRDARTGAVRWHYTRSDQTLCSVVQQDQTTIAVYNRHGHCSQMTGFETSTGNPKWYRTLSDVGSSVSASAPNVVVLVARRSVHVTDNAGGLDRWMWTAPADCLVDRALAGSLGVLVGYHCGSSHRLLLHDLIGEKELWNITLNADAIPIAAHAFLGAIEPSTGMLCIYSTAKGVLTKRLPFAKGDWIAGALAALPRAGTTFEPNGKAAAGSEFVWIEQLNRVSGTGRVQWAAQTGEAQQLDQATLAAAGRRPGQIAIIRITDGKTKRTVSLTPAPTGAFQPFPVGHGFVLAGTTTEMYQ